MIFFIKFVPNLEANLYQSLQVKNDYSWAKGESISIVIHLLFN